LFEKKVKKKMQTRFRIDPEFLFREILRRLFARMYK